MVTVGSVFTASACQQRAQPQQPDVAYHQTLIGWSNR
jgi:hypothetical protein